LKADSGWLGGYPRNLCVTGTFTQNTLAQVAPRGRLSPGAYGDGLKRRDRQSRFDPSGARAPSGSARTPPPAFPFLLCTCQRARPAVSEPLKRSGLRRPVAKKSRHSARTPQACLVSNRRLLPTGRTPVRGAREFVSNIKGPSCQPLP
jgi:hypothetical protein